MAEAIFNQPHFQDADEARAYLERQVWPQGPVCPHCGSCAKPYALQGKSNRPGLYKCADCREPFTVTVGSIFERSKIPLHKWLLAVYLLCSSKKGMSSHQLHRTLGVTYKTAWFMTHRIREAMNQPHFQKFGYGGAPVEVDETYWGTLKDAPKARGGAQHKMKIVSLVERGGAKQTHILPRITAANVREVLVKQVHERARLMTDESSIYQTVGLEFAEHGVVNHSAGEYARGDVTTNSAESSFALLKRGLVGTFHHVGEQHIQRYAHEFDFRWNHRVKLGYGDKERADACLRGTQGKRLTYRRTH
jgi:transposase-like protein